MSVCRGSSFSAKGLFDWRWISTSLIIITKGITKAGAIFCCSRPANRRIALKDRFPVGNGSADCSNTTTVTPHEFFDRTTTWLCAGRVFSYANIS